MIINECDSPLKWLERYRHSRPHPIGVSVSGNERVAGVLTRGERDLLEAIQGLGLAAREPGLSSDTEAGKAIRRWKFILKDYFEGSVHERLSDRGLAPDDPVELRDRGDDIVVVAAVGEFDVSNPVDRVGYCPESLPIIEG